MVSRPNTVLYARIFSEPPIQVIAGSTKSSYFVHPGALSWCKKSALNARVDGPWKPNEANGPVDWSEFDEQTVECVLSYLYTQDYYVTRLESDLDEGCRNGDDSKATTGIEPLVSTSAEPLSSNAMPDNQGKLNRPLTPLSRCLEAGLPADNKQTAAGACTYRASHNPNDNPGAEILIHAKVYCFAHHFCINKLEVFALQRLTKILLIIDEETEAVFPYLADAIRVVYSSTPGADLQDNPARKLLSQYVALNYTIFESESIGRIMAEGGDFMVDLSHKLARRLDMNGIGAQSLEEQIDQLQLKINELELGLQEKEVQLQTARNELREWESWNRGISGKCKKVKRKVQPKNVYA